MIRKFFPYAFMILSGFAGLGYEMVWVRSLSAGLGHEIISMLSVLAAFFVGIALGAWLLDRPVRNSRKPEKWYAVLEMIIAFWAIALSFLIPKTALLGAGIMGVHPSAFLQWSTTFLLPLVLLLPATMAMGATLPAMECIAGRMQQKTRLVGGLYGANTLGAVAGTLATTFWIVPAAGFSHTQYLLAMLNIICALGVLGFGRSDVHPHKKPDRDMPVSFSSGRLVLTLFLTGLLGIGYEVVAVRIISQVLENTVFSYAALLSVYLTGTAAGAAFYQNRLVNKDFVPTVSRLLTAQALACIAGMWILSFSPGIYAFFRYFGIRTSEFCLAAAAFLGPTLVMGALFSHLAQAAKQNGKGLGPALAINTLGGALAPFLFGIVLMPLWGPAGALFPICISYLLLLPGGHQMPVRLLSGCAVAAALIFTVSGPFDFNNPASGEQVVSHRHGIMASVTVVRDAARDYHLKVNNHYQMGGTASRYSDQRQAHIPLLLHPNPRRVLFLGLGTGITFATAGRYDNLQADGVELIPEVVELIPNFQAETVQNKNMHIFTADARRFILARFRQYDVIIADLFHPSRDGAGFLYTKEHFSAIDKRLSADGIFCQWLPLYQMDLNLLRLIARTFLEVFPNTAVFIAHHSLTQPIVGLIGSRQPLGAGTDIFNQRMADHPGLAGHLRSVGLSSSYTLLGCYLADGPQLKEFAGPGPVNTDDHPRVLFQAPEFVYDSKISSSASADRLMTLVQAFTPRARDILAPVADNIEKSRLTAYWQARNAYLSTGRHATVSPDQKNKVVQLAEQLLEIVRISPDFESAYRPLLLMAAKLRQQNPQAAEKLLAALEVATLKSIEAGSMRIK